MSRDHDAQNKNVQGLLESLEKNRLDYRSDYHNADLNTDTFIGIHFVGADFSGADLTDSSFENCIFELCSFEGAIADRAHFEACTFDNVHAPSGIIYNDGPKFTGCIWGP